MHDKLIVAKHLLQLLQVQRVLHGGDVRGADRGDDHHVRAGGRRAVGQPEHRRVHPASDGEHPLQAQGELVDFDA